MEQHDRNEGENTEATGCVNYRNQDAGFTQPSHRILSYKRGLLSGSVRVRSSGLVNILSGRRRVGQWRLILFREEMEPEIDSVSERAGTQFALREEW